MVIGEGGVDRDGDLSGLGDFWIPVADFPLLVRLSCD